MAVDPRDLILGAALVGGRAGDAPATRLVVALGRAGALGVLDLPDPAGAGAAVAAVAARTDAPFAIRPGTAVAGSRFVDELDPAVTTVLLDAGVVATLGAEALPELVATWRGRRVLVEVTSAAEALAAIDAGADGLIAKGAESGGAVGDTEAFVLLQQTVGLGVPVWARGGIGRHTAAAAIAAGATGVFLDVQLALVRESPLPVATRRAIAAMDGTETRVLGGHRVYTRPGLPVATRPEHEAAELVRGELGPDVRRDLLPVGQDAATAASLAATGKTASGVVASIRAAIDDHLEAAAAHRPLAPGNGVAARRGTRHPIAQGPMTRVSDTAAFAASVADGGGLPFLALALLRGAEVDALLRETADLLGDRPWGVGILGFVPPELRDEQLAVVGDVRPPVALIAGGRPSQAAPLDDAGIATYLHVPSPGLLDRFLKDGARRFVFEGRECGGHVGPRASFPLWEAQIERLLSVDDAEHLELLFAGGIHDARSAAAVAAAAGPLAARGAAIGVLMGTAYLFTKEAVAGGAIVPAFQDAAVACERTVLLETSPGHATRCVESGYVRAFRDAKAALEADGVDAKAMWAELETLNLGRLRLASKGLTHGAGPDGERELVTVDEESQRREGMYMIGQVAALRHEVTTVADLHAEVSDGATDRLDAVVAARAAAAATDAADDGDERTPPPLRVAIVGMASLFPGSTSTEELWSMVLAGANAITEVPPERWDVERYFDPASTTVGAGERTPSKWGGFLPPVGFDPLAYGIPPASLAAVEPVQLLSLEVAARALADAGYADRPFDRSRASVVFGAENGNDLSAAYGLRAVLPQLLGEVPPELDAHLPRLTEDSFPGVLTNVIAGRIANRLDLGGVNFTVDAACAASLAAVDAACKELVSGNSDLVLCGGADVHNGLNDFLLFSSVHALSPTGQCRTFDASADGIALGEGIACVVLKRLDDAERDGDRVYAVIDAVAGSSDGRHLGLTAPRKEGQQRALERAYRQARRSPAELGLVEAHGTGTVVGDRTELATLTELFAEHGAEVGACVLGSVKSQIGHTKCAAGLAGLIKAARAVYHGVLPPTGNLVDPNPAYDAGSSPFRFLHEPRPWLGEARHAGVSAFGFGGANFHAVLSSHDGDDGPAHGVEQWPAELFLVRAADPEAAAERLEQLSTLVDSILATDPLGQRHRLRDLARTVTDAGSGPVQVALVARDLGDLADKLVAARGGTGRKDGAFLRADVPDEVLADGARVAFLHPGQGSQRPGMLADLFVAFPRLRPLLEVAAPWVHLLYPPAAFGPAERAAQAAAVTDTRVAQPLLGVGGLAVTALLDAVGVRPDVAGGHSYGELVALTTAGALDPATLLRLSQARGDAIVASAAARGDDPGTMAAVNADIGTVRTVLRGRGDVVVANHNGPDQVVISGATAAVEGLVTSLGATGIAAKALNVACAFHSPLLADAPATFGADLDAASIGSPSIPVYANSTAAPYPSEPDGIRAILRDQLTSEVRFVDEIEAMYAAGVRTFVEAGPGRVLTQLVGKVLGNRPHRAVACDASGEPGLRRFLLALAELAVTGVELDTDVLFEDRAESLPMAELPRRAPGWVLDGHLAHTADGAVVAGSLQPATSFPSLSATSAGGGPAGASAREATVLEYLRSVREVVAAEREVMLRYLGAPPEAIEARVVEPVAPLVAAPGAVTDHTAPVAVTSVPRGDALLAVVLQIVADRTGYPTDMLDPDLDLEADLSIDSIKRIEIIGELAERIGLDAGGAIGDDVVEELARLKTLREIVAFVDPLVAATPAAGTGASATTDHAGHGAVPRGDALLAVVLQIVADRTGYPADMLDPDLDLEADLSIDSIKRIEIIGELAERIGLDAGGAIGDEVVEELARLKSLREIVAWIDAIDDTPGTEAQVAADPPAVIDLTDLEGADHRVPERALRLTWQAVPLDPADPSGLADLAGATVVVATDATDATDVAGVGAHVAERLHVAGARVEVVDASTPPSDAHHGLLAAADALVWLPALDGAASTDPERFDARAAFAWWQPAVLGGVSRIVVATPGAGSFAGPGLGLGGMAKAIARERSDVTVRIVDVDPATAPHDLATCLVAELADRQGPVEVGHTADGRSTRVPVPADAPVGAGLSLDASSVVLLTGGARGITALAAVELARRHGCRIELVGRTPLPDADEPATTATALDRIGLRRALLDAGRHTTPAAIEAECDRILAAREVRATMAALREARVEADYHAVDVVDADAFGGVLDGIVARHGRLDLVVHGAGVLDDRLVQDKTTAGFQRVFATKVDAARTILRHTGDATTVVLFGSVSGAFGNRGQVDYSAANAALDELAGAAREVRGGRVLAIDWGPWAGTGMVSPELEREYARRGVGLVERDDGVTRLLDEVASAGPPQVIVLRAEPGAIAPDLAGSSAAGVGAPAP